MKSNWYFNHTFPLVLLRLPPLEGRDRGWGSMDNPPNAGSGYPVTVKPIEPSVSNWVST
jgi:hypothetical protein